MRVTVISTFRGGRLNIGDHLITKATVKALNELFGEMVDVSVVFRAEDWELAKPIIENSDFIVFACLAIRRNQLRAYSFLDKVIDSGIPYGILAAGTSLPTYATRMNFARTIDEDDLDILKRLAQGARFFTTRGVLTQRFCEDLGIRHTTMEGDVAFIDSRFRDRVFSPPKNISRIAISDPHYSESFTESLEHLLKSLKHLFPEAQIDLLIHGVNEVIEEKATEVGLETINIYKDSQNGLDSYDDYDLHVGYRVHGHVSALSRRIPSYLLEQDGRGCDYGLTISRRISTPHFRPRNVGHEHTAGTAGVDQIITIIQTDLNRNFSRFDGLEVELENFAAMNRRRLESIREIIN